MGSPVTFVSNSSFIHPPEWLRVKWENHVTFGPEILCKTSQKGWYLLELDIQKAMRETTRRERCEEIVLVYVNECGNVDRVVIRETSIHYAEPTGWRAVDRLKAHNGWDECVDTMAYLHPLPDPAPPMPQLPEGWLRPVDKGTWDGR